MGQCRLLYFVNSKNVKNYAVLLCFYVNTFILLYFLRWGYSPPSHPSKSATGSMGLMALLVCQKFTSMSHSIYMDIIHNNSIKGRNESGRVYRSVFIGKYRCKLLVKEFSPVLGIIYCYSIYLPLYLVTSFTLFT